MLTYVMHILANALHMSAYANICLHMLAYACICLANAFHVCIRVHVSAYTMHITAYTHMSCICDAYALHTPSYTMQMSS